MRLEYARKPSRFKKSWSTPRLILSVFAVLFTAFLCYFAGLLTCFKLGFLNPTD